jgi:hypothetical protein
MCSRFMCLCLPSDPCEFCTGTYPVRDGGGE